MRCYDSPDAAHDVDDDVEYQEIVLEVEPDFAQEVAVELSELDDERQRVQPQGSRAAADRREVPQLNDDEYENADEECDVEACGGDGSEPGHPQQGRLGNDGCVVVVVLE